MRLGSVLPRRWAALIKDLSSTKIKLCKATLKIVKEFFSVDSVETSRGTQNTQPSRIQRRHRGTHPTTQMPFLTSCARGLWRRLHPSMQIDCMTAWYWYCLLGK
jgi:hypothetical protein